MALPSIVHSNIVAELRSSPIEPAWVHEGNPTARNAVLSRSADGMAVTMVWDCTPGKFEWHYDRDETIHILEGSIILDDGNAPVRRLGPGDVVFFPKGAVVKWVVETHVRKLAFFRRTLPNALGMVLRVMGKANEIIRAKTSPKTARKTTALGDVIHAPAAAAIYSAGTP